MNEVELRQKIYDGLSDKSVEISEEYKINLGTQGTYKVICSATDEDAANHIKQ